MRSGFFVSGFVSNAAMVSGSKVLNQEVEKVLRVALKNVQRSTKTKK